MIPWQIYADYLEDKGSDTRLFRVSEPLSHIDIIDPTKIFFTGNGDGWGNGHDYGFLNGDGDASENWTYGSGYDGRGDGYSFISLAQPGNGGEF